MSNYMKKYGFFELGLCMNRGESSRDSHIFLTVKDYNVFANEISIFLTN